MNREQFIRELEQLLKDLPAGEREAAIQYYNDYFDRSEEHTSELQSLA